MARNRILGVVGLAAVALATGFLLAGQVKAQLLTPSNEVGRYQALVRSVQDLEKTNEASRAKIAALRAEIDALEGAAAQQSATTRELQNQVADLRAHAGLTAVHGPGVEIDLGNGTPAPDQAGGIGYLINYQDVQDVVNLVFARGAEGVSVSGRRITPLSAFSGSPRRSRYSSSATGIVCWPPSTIRHLYSTCAPVRFGSRSRSQSPASPT